MDEERHYYYVTFRGKVLGGFWVGRAKDRGFYFGPVINGSGLHLTFLEKDGRVGYHITQEGSEKPPDRYPIDAHRSTKLVGNTIVKMLSRTLVNYHGNGKCWVVTPERWKKIKSIQLKAGVGSDTYLPLEYLLAELDMDFSRRDLWQRVPIRSLVDLEPRIAFMESKRRSLNLIWPLSRAKLISLSFSKLTGIIRYLWDISGMNDFFNYMKETEEGKQFWAEFKSRLKRELAKKR